jgi:hypothetical protein
VEWPATAWHGRREKHLVTLLPIEAPPPAHPPLRTAVKAELCRELNITARTFEAWQKQPGFPQPIRAGGHPRWFVADIVGFLRRQEVAHAE